MTSCVTLSNKLNLPGLRNIVTQLRGLPGELNELQTVNSHALASTATQ